ncbi:M1 family metallopeptidase [Ferruginibacter albus]|uniref:M1 family metallopeptidase n=1 Tax=Ferruginibacter albus TaxID=2875540 RepID=UPI001CC5B5EA|nr:M1 family metallopeptidase [Ferruginibacter albus]UAY50619.1 M1 family metallopeptidase [Ferruginibacter albus]
MNKHFNIIVLLIFSLFTIDHSQAQPFTHADTLRGSNVEGRSWWDVQRYDLNVSFNINDSTIKGQNTITFKELRTDSVFQIDLQEPLIIDDAQLEIGTANASSYEQANALNMSGTIQIKAKEITRQGNAYFLKFTIPPNLVKEYNVKEYKEYKKLIIDYHGKPTVAIKPPWDGGLVWTKDKLDRPWVSIACQGLGASVWYPCKDYQGDEPDNGASLTITAPDTLMAVSNGRLSKTVDNKDGTKTYTWEVKSPINNYNLIPYIGKYVHFGEVYNGEKGKLDMDYWVLDYNLDKAKEHFKDATRMMKAFEYWFGPYPFYEDGYKLVDAPYLGMEHQSAVAYGNGYRMGYYGQDLSGTGWGMKWDFMIVHESGHEWFGNNITTKDIADMWVHEGFTNYSEALFTEYYYGKEAGNDYVIGLRKNIENKEPIITAYGVNKEPEIDMYYKAANMLHTIRQVINNDSLFRQILRGLNKTFYHQTVTTKQIEDYISQQSKINFSKVFDQYLRTINIPTLEYKLDNKALSYRWTNCVSGFDLPLKINCNGEHWIKPAEQWQTLNMPPGENKFSVDRNFYINTKKVN